MIALGQYLAETARRRWNYGDEPGPKHDCCVFTADWCVASGYPDPMAFIRGRYASEAEALAHVRSAGLLRLATRGYRSIGLKTTKVPLCGDVAVIRRSTAEGDDVTCAIRSADRWVTVIPQGLVVHEGGELLRAWRVEWARP